MYIKPEIEITAKETGLKYKVANVDVKVSDSSPEYAGRYIRVAFFEYKDKKDATKNRSATSKAEYFKKNSEGADILLDITESQTEKSGVVYDNLNGKTLNKAQKEVAEQFLK